MAWTDFITFRINTSRNNPSQILDVKIQKQGTPITGSPYTECVATATGNEFSYRSLSNNYNNTQVRSFFKCSFIPRGVFPSFIEQVFSQVPTKDLRVVLNQGLIWQGFYTENSFRIERDTQPDGTITLEFSDGLERLDNIQYADFLGRKRPGGDTILADVLANIFNGAGYGVNEQVYDYSLITYYPTTPGNGIVGGVFRNFALLDADLQDGSGNFRSCGEILNQIMIAVNCFIMLDCRNYDRFYIVTNNWVDHIGKNGRLTIFDFAQGTVSDSPYTVTIGADIRTEPAKGIRSSVQNSIQYKENILTTPGGTITRNYGWGTSTEYVSTVSADYANQAGDTYGFLLFSPNLTTANQYQQPSDSGPSRALRDLTVDWFFGGYGDNTNFRKPFYVDYSISDWNASNYHTFNPWFGLEDKELMKTDLLNKFRYMKIISINYDCFTMRMRMRCIGYAYFGGI